MIQLVDALFIRAHSIDLSLIVLTSGLRGEKPSAMRILDAKTLNCVGGNPLGHSGLEPSHKDVFPGS